VTPTVDVHFLTDAGGSTGSSAAGSVIIQLLSTFAPSGGGSVNYPTNTYNTTVAGVTTSSSGTTYNHYVASFTLSSDTIGARYFAILNITRSGSDVNPGVIYLTSLDFTYSTT
jgi:hypothetical protein